MALPGVVFEIWRVALLFTGRLAGTALLLHAGGYYISLLVLSVTPHTSVVCHPESFCSQEIFAATLLPSERS